MLPGKVVARLGALKTIRVLVMGKLADYAISLSIGAACVIGAAAFIGDIGSDTEKTVVKTAIVLWFASGYYLNSRLAFLHEKIDLMSEQIARLDAKTPIADRTGGVDSVD